MPGDTAARHLGAAAWIGHEGADAKFMWPYMFDKVADEYDRRYGLDEAHLRAIAQLNFANARAQPQRADPRMDGARPDRRRRRDNPLIEGRLRRFDCSQMTDGGAGSRPGHRRYLRDHPGARPIARIAGWGHRTVGLGLQQKLDRAADDPYVLPHVRAAVLDALRPRPGRRSTTSTAIEVHDCFTPSEYLAIDHIGLTGPGESWKAIENGEIEIGGRLPINPSGGLIGGGHPVGASGVRMLVDAAKQVSGAAGDYQVEDAKTFGTLNFGGSTATTVSFVVSATRRIVTMDVEIVGKFLSTLPEDDDHPYRTGPWRPQTTEWDADDLTAVEGEIPPRPRRRLPAQHREPAAPGDEVLPPVRRRRHGARGRVPRRKGVLPQPVYPHRRFPGRERGGRAAVAGAGRTGAVRQARTGLGRAHPDEGRVEHRRHRAPRHRADQLLPVRRSVPSRPVLGRHAGQGDLERPASRPTGACRRTRRSTTRPANCCSSTTASRRRTCTTASSTRTTSWRTTSTFRCPARGCRTTWRSPKTTPILNDFPLFWDPQAARTRRPPAAVPPRHAVTLRGDSRAAAAPSEIRWFEADPTFVLHFTNAYEDGDEIVLDGFFEGAPQPASTPVEQVGQALSLPGAGPAAGPAAPLAVQPGHRRGARRAVVRHHHRVRHDQRRLRGRRLPLRLRRHRQAGLVPVRRAGQARPAHRQRGALPVRRRRLRQRNRDGTAARTPPARTTAT